MAKTKVKKEAVEKNISIDSYFDKYFWLVIPVLAVVYFVLSRYSTGFYQDDEIQQYVNMLDFWKNPWAILGNAAKPGYKIFMVLPALVSYDVVLFFSALIASTTVFLTYKLIKLYGINYAFFGALLMAAQPTYFDLSFRCYPEIFTALLFVIFLILYKKEKYAWAALVIGYIFTVRQEIALFAIILAVVYIKKKHYKEVLLMGVFPLVYDLLGYMMNGDIIYIYSEMRNVSAFEYKMEYPQFYHYLQTYIFVVGPVSLVLFVQGFFSFLADKEKMKEYFSKYFLLYILFILVLIIHTSTMLIKANPGNWRYILHISPICAVFATIGLNTLAEARYKMQNYVIAGILIFITFVFLSKQSDGRVLLDVNDYTKVLFLLVMFAVTAVIPKGSPVGYLNKVSVILLLLAVVYLSVDFKPKVLSSENMAVKNASEYLNAQNFEGRSFYTNHPLMKFYSSDYKKDPSRFSPLNSRTLPGAPKGSIVAWETHYGYRPDPVWKCDTKLEDLQNNPDYKMLNQFSSVDRRFVIFFFEKQN